MKSVLIIIAFIFVLPMVGQKEKAIIHFKDGTTVTGMAKVITSGARIKFRKEKKSKYKVYTSEEVESIEMYEKEPSSFNINSNVVYAHYFYIKTTKNVLPRLLKIIEDGKVKLYLDYKDYSTTLKTGSNNMGPSTSSISSYYVSRDNQEFVTHLGDRGNLFSKNFKKAASEYFKDCPSLVKKLQAKEFKKREIEEVVNYYNRNCE